MADATVVRERPILFSGVMVRAILDGRKTQTRRVMKPQPDSLKPLGFHGAVVPYRCGPEVPDMPGVAVEVPIDCPYGVPGDRLWVREAWGDLHADRPGTPGGRRPMAGDDVRYRADTDQDWQWRDGTLPWRPSIHMPRWASRLTLEITEVRVERLQGITEEDARAEGITPAPYAWKPLGATEPFVENDHRHEFRLLWNRLNAARGFSWGANPWVWVLTFRVVPT